MSGVAQDDNGSSPKTDETADAAAKPENAQPQPSDTSTEARTEKAEAKSRRGAPHLRVVADNESAPAEPAVSLNSPGLRIGAVIKAARENMGLQLEQVSKETRIHLSHLRAIEEMTPALLGAPVYAKGYIRNYARHLKLDPDLTLKRYLSECAILADPAKQGIDPLPASGRRLPVAVPVLGLLVVALAVGGGLYAVTQSQQGKAPLAKSAKAGKGAAAAPVIDDAATPIAPPLNIVALKEAHIEVRSADGTKIRYSTMKPGDPPFYPRTGANWTVSTNDGSAFEWRLGEQSLGAMGDGPIFAQSIDAALKRIPSDAPAAPAAATAPSALDANARVPAQPGAPGPATKPPTPGAQPATAPTAAAGTPPAPKPRPKPPLTPPAASAVPPAQSGAPQIGTAPVPTNAAARAASPQPVTDPSLLAYPPQ